MRMIQRLVDGTMVLGIPGINHKHAQLAAGATVFGVEERSHEVITTKLANGICATRLQMTRCLAVLEAYNIVISHQLSVTKHRNIREAIPVLGFKISDRIVNQPFNYP